MMKKIIGLFTFAVLILVAAQCDKKDDDPENGTDILQIISATAGDKNLKSVEVTEEVPVDATIMLRFSKELDTTKAKEAVSLRKGEETAELTYFFMDEQKTLSINPVNDLDYFTEYTLEISDKLEGSQGETFSGITYSFKTRTKQLDIESITLNGENFDSGELKNVDFDITLEAQFSSPVNPEQLQKNVRLTYRGSPENIETNLSEDRKTLTVTNSEELDYYRPYKFKLDKGLASNGSSFEGFTNRFFTRLDSTNKFPVISDDALLTKIQEQTFRYFWDYAHPSSGMARERYGSGNTVTAGGSGFGIMSLIVGIERGFISRQQGVERLEKIVSFLEDAERFHGAWSHWINGETGNAIPFSPDDDGADLVETAFLMQGLLTFRQYLDSQTNQENELISRIDTLWRTVEWDWFTNEEDALYWHWSPNNGFGMDMKIRGHNETQITYILAMASPTHSISQEIYHSGYAQNGGMVNGDVFYDYKLPLGPDYGGPLFFTHYSYLGLNPKLLQDDYADYWQQNINHTLINRAYCIDNPKDYIGYSEDCWGLTASDNHEGYSAHSPTNDLGVITPTAAISSIPYTPEESMDAIKHFYYKLGDRIWGEYGFHDAFNVTENWYADSYLAIDQGPIIVMIENYRTGLLWDLFMSHPAIEGNSNQLNINH